MPKSLLFTVLAFSTVALGGLYVRETIHSHQLEVRLSNALRAGEQRQQLEAQLAIQTRAVAELTEEKTRADGKAEARRQKLAAAVPVSTPVETAPPSPPEPPASAATAPDGKTPTALGGMKDYVAKMMKNPAMRQMVRSSQQLALKQLYGDLVKQWSLSPEDADAFYNLLLDKQMSTIDLGGSADPATATKTMAESEAAIKNSLGDAMYKQYQDYEKTAPDRTLLNLYKQQLAAADLQALTSDQSNYLMQIMREERQNRPAGQIFGKDTNAALMKGQFTMDQKAVDGFVQSQTELNEKVALRAAAMLTPPQLASFKQYQQQTLEMQKAGMAMAAQMSGDGKP